MPKARYTLLAAFAAALFNIIPLLMIVPSGDAIMNYAQIECYSKHLWSGLFYPRWCMDPNGGMGSPGPIFYFPLPFYIAALFQPLQQFGLGVHGQYLAGIFLANMLAFVSCMLWLRPRVGFGVALLAALIFLWCGYRSELITRTSYAEYWCVSLLPLLFYYIRQLCDRHWQTWPKLALVIALCMFCHAPVTLIGLMGSGLFVLFYARARITKLAELALSCLLAAMLGLFHYLPMKLLEPTLNPEMGGPSHWQKSWVNSFIDQPQIYQDHHWAVMGLGIGLLAALIIFALFWRGRSAITDDNTKREALCWLGIAAVAALMMFSVSAPLWWVVQKISGVITPWRVPSLIMLAMVYVGAVMCEYVWRHRRTHMGDALLGLMFFILSGLFYYGGVAPETLSIHRQAVAEQMIIKYFDTRDVDKEYGTDPRNFYRDFIDRPGRKQVEWVRGGGAFSITQWNEHGITITGHAVRNGTLRLEHFYYPIWQATINNTPANLTAEAHKGRMLIEIPKGDFNLSLTQHYGKMLPNYFWLVWLAFALAAGVIGVVMFHNRSITATRPSAVQC